MLTVRYLPATQESTIYSYVIPRAVRRLADGTQAYEFGIRDATYAAWRTLCEDKCFHRPDGEEEDVRYAELLYGGQIKGEWSVVDFPIVVAAFDGEKELIVPRSQYPIDLDVERAVGYMEKFHNSKKPFEV
jgi:hypothetical protein